MALPQTLLPQTVGHEQADLLIPWPPQPRLHTLAHGAVAGAVTREQQEAAAAKGRMGRAGKRLFMARRAERMLASYQREGWLEDQPSRPTGRNEYRPAAEMGPIIVCLDTSYSMAGKRETVAKVGRWGRDPHAGRWWHVACACACCILVCRLLMSMSRVSALLSVSPWPIHSASMGWLSPSSNTALQVQHISRLVVDLCTLLPTAYLKSRYLDGLQMLG